MEIWLKFYPMVYYMDINYSVCFLLSFNRFLNRFTGVRYVNMFFIFASEHYMNVCLSGGAPAMEERKKTRENPEKEERRWSFCGKSSKRKEKSRRDWICNINKRTTGSARLMCNTIIIGWQR